MHIIDMAKVELMQAISHLLHTLLLCLTYQIPTYLLYGPETEKITSPYMHTERNCITTVNIAWY